MAIHSILASLLTCALCTDARAAFRHETGQHNSIQLKHSKAQAFMPPSADVATETWTRLSRHHGKGSDSRATAMRRMLNGDVPIASLDGSDKVSYSVPITWNELEYQAILDTGSADTWLIAADFDCVDFNGISVPQEVCAFGPGYNGPFLNNTKLGFYTSYAGGEEVLGDIGTVAMSVAGLVVPEQNVALAKAAIWSGTNDASGLRELGTSH